jgi:acyl-CoA hydrolase
MTAPRTVDKSRVEKTEIVLPQHANALGTAFGGSVMSWVDVCAAVTAQRHCGRIAVTVSIDALHFRAPLRVGDVVVLRSWMNAAFGSSMEVECVVEREDTATGERTLCVDALLTFVNVDDAGKPMPIPELLAETEEDRARAAAARKRRERRLADR